jgi:response regulator RpfG family c-di-GMP phosphodiesterase
MSVTLVDDEPWALDVLVRAAQRWCYDCQAAACAEDALRLLEKNPTPIVVTDIRMPGRGGLWLVEEIRRRWPDVGIIVITAGHDHDAVAECLNAGAHHYFMKPVHFEEFRHALATTARNFQLQQENNHYRRELEQTVRRQTLQIRQTFLSAIDSLVRTLEARDSYTSGHSLRVRRYAVALARKVAADAQLQKRVSLAAKLHDIGKVGLPETILNKAGPLSESEAAVVREHPVIGERILSPIIRNRAILAGIRGHHERYDGGGYPDGLAGDRIPWIARVIAVTDCFDALTSSRAYRQARTVSEALDVLRAGSGNQFDPELVAPFLDLVLQGRLVATMRCVGCS